MVEAALAGGSARAQRVASSLLYFNAFFGMGLLLSNLGPILPQLMQRTGLRMGAMGFLVASRSLGYLIGCATSGGLYDRFAARGHWLEAGGIAVASACNSAITLCYSAALLGAILLVQGVAIGFLDTGCNVMMLRQHREGVGPWLQTLHLFFGVGAFVQPLLVSATMARDGGFALAFHGTALWMVLGAAPLLMLPAPPVPAPASASSVGKAGAPTAPAQRRRSVVLLLGAFLFTYVGTEVNYGTYILTYAQREVQITEHAGQLLTAAYWGALALGRLIAVGITLCGAPPQALIAVNCVLCTAASLVMALAPASSLVLWAGSITFGLAMASQFPSAMHLASRYTTISGTDQGIVNQAACMGEIVLPIAVSQLFERVGATTFMPGNVVLSLLSAVAFAALWAAGERSARAAAAGSEDATEATPLLLSADLSHTIQE